MVWMPVQGDIRSMVMPLTPEEDIDWQRLQKVLNNLTEFYGDVHIYLERALSYGMLAGSAFNYGRNYGYLEIAIQTAGVPCTYIEPSKWTKAICDGIDKRLKPKVRSEIAYRRLFPTHSFGDVTKKAREGLIDALLIAEYGRRALAGELGG